jgi:hypothetical protein
MYRLSQGYTDLRKKQRLSAIVTIVSLVGWLLLIAFMFDAIFFNCKLLMELL